MGEAVKGFLERDDFPSIAGCGSFGFNALEDVRVAVGQNDPGVYKRARELLRPYAGEYRHVFVIIDEEWSGSPGADAIERRLREHLDNAGWSNSDSIGLAVRPEADIWLWSGCRRSAEALGWESWDGLRARLEQEGFLVPPSLKPGRPKEAAQWAVKNGPHTRPWSAAIFRQVTSCATVDRCEDAALSRMLSALRAWFPAEGA